MSLIKGCFGSNIIAGYCYHQGSPLFLVDLPLWWDQDQGHIQETGGVVGYSLLWIYQLWGYWIPQGIILIGPFAEDISLSFCSIGLCLTSDPPPHKAHLVSFIRSSQLLHLFRSGRFVSSDTLHHSRWIFWFTLQALIQLAWIGLPVVGVQQEEWRALTQSVLLRKLLEYFAPCYVISWIIVWVNISPALRVSLTLSYSHANKHLVATGVRC